MIAEIQKIDMKDSDIVVVTLDIGNLPQHVARKFCEEAALNLQGKFPKNKVVVLPSSHKITILSPDE